MSGKIKLIFTSFSLVFICFLYFIYTQFQELNLYKQFATINDLRQMLIQAVKAKNPSQIKDFYCPISGEINNKEREETIKAGFNNFWNNAKNENWNEVNYRNITSSDNAGGAGFYVEKIKLGEKIGGRKFLVSGSYRQGLFFKQPYQCFETLDLVFEDENSKIKYTFENNAL